MATQAAIETSCVEEEKQNEQQVVESKIKNIKLEPWDEEQKETNTSEFDGVDEIKLKRLLKIEQEKNKTLTDENKELLQANNDLYTNFMAKMAQVEKLKEQTTAGSRKKVKEMEQKVAEAVRVADFLRQEHTKTAELLRIEQLKTGQK